MLSTREKEILRIMASGQGNKEITKACFIAEGTVKNHVSIILSNCACVTGPAPCCEASSSG